MRGAGSKTKEEAVTKTEMKIKNIEQIFTVKEAGRVLELYYEGKSVGEIKMGAVNRFPADYDGQVELFEYLLEILAKHREGTLLEFGECDCKDCNSVVCPSSLENYIYIYGAETTTAPDHELTADFDGRVMYASGLNIPYGI